MASKKVADMTPEELEAYRKYNREHHKKWADYTPEERAIKTAYKREWNRAHPYVMSDEQKERANARRRERYKNNAEYREKCKARSQAYSKTDAGRERNRINQQKWQDLHKYGIIDEDRYLV